MFISFNGIDTFASDFSGDLATLLLLAHVSREVKERELRAFKMVRKLLMLSVKKKGTEMLVG